MPGTRVLIVDDHAGFRGLARRILEEGGFDVVGEARDAAEALREARSLEPDLVLLDIHLPDGDGYQVSSELTGDPHPPAVVLTSTHEPDDVIPAVEASGARGFVPKHRLESRTVASFL